MSSSIEQGTEENEKKHQLAKECRERVRFGKKFMLEGRFFIVIQEPVF